MRSAPIFFGPTLLAAAILANPNEISTAASTRTKSSVSLDASSPTINYSYDGRRSSTSTTDASVSWSTSPPFTPTARLSSANFAPPALFRTTFLTKNNRSSLYNPKVLVFGVRGGADDEDDDGEPKPSQKRRGGKSTKRKVGSDTPAKEERSPKSKTSTTPMSSAQRSKKTKRKATGSARVGEQRNDAPISKKDVGKESEGAKHAINEAMKESDAATALGDAIRKNADLLRRDSLPYSERTFDAALVSLGLSIGTAGTDGAPSKRDGASLEEDEVEKVDTTAYYQYGHRNSLYPFSNRREGGGGVQPSPSAVVANYFLKTHGGTHAIQCLLSLLSSLFGISSLLLPAFPSASNLQSQSATAESAAKMTAKQLNAQSLSNNILFSATKFQLMQQCLLFAMAKHASGFLGAVLLGASRIPELGLRNTRRHLELVAQDPIGQYLFYCSLLVVWMGWFGSSCSGGMREYLGRLRGNVISIMNNNLASSGANAAEGTSAVQESTVSQLLSTLAQSPPPWYLSKSSIGNITPFLFLGPILLREVISIMWVFSDVLTLVVTTSKGTPAKIMHKVLQGCRSMLDAFMSILVTSDRWRKGDSFQKQRTLATLVAQSSLVMELGVGGILMVDAISAFWNYFFGSNVSFDGAYSAGAASNGKSGGSRMPFIHVVGKIVCAHLYANFLMARRKKIQTLVGSIRGGAILDRVLDVLIDPDKAMGLSDDEEENYGANPHRDGKGSKLRDGIKQTASVLGIGE